MSAMGAPPDGTPWWAWLATVLLLGGLGFCGTLLGQRRNTRAIGHVVEQVKNEHDINLRDDLDDKDATTKSMLDELIVSIAGITASIEVVQTTQGEHGAALVINAAAVTRLDKSVGGLHDDLRQSRDRDRGLDDRLTHIEQQHHH